MLNNPLFKIVKIILGKLWQSPEEYPVRYYKREKRFKTKW